MRIRRIEHVRHWYRIGRRMMVTMSSFVKFMRSFVYGKTEGEMIKDIRGYE